MFTSSPIETVDTLVSPAHADAVAGSPLAAELVAERRVRSPRTRIVQNLAAIAIVALALLLAAAPARAGSSVAPAYPVVHHRTVEIDGVSVFYREAGDPSRPTVLLLHGFPTSSHMFRNLIPRLADRYHVVAPDYPGYGNSDAPPVDAFEYTFDNMASIVRKLIEHRKIDRYTLYLMDYGAPVGYRIAAADPQKVDALIVQNGNAYVEGLREFWDPIRKYWDDPSKANGHGLRQLLTLEATKWQYTHGTRDASAISPDNWRVDQPLLDRPGNQEIQLAMFYDYRTNVPLYPSWQRYLREHQPPTLIVWGRNDVIFPAEGAHPYKRDLEPANLEFHLLDTGHFALEEDGPTIAALIRDFLARRVK